MTSSAGNSGRIGDLITVKWFKLNHERPKSDLKFPKFIHSKSFYRSGQISSCMDRIASRGLPRFWEYLSEEDMRLYLVLQQKLAEPKYQYQRYRARNAFSAILREIREYCQGDTAAARCLVCGFFCSDDYIATETLQLRTLLGKSKSGINGLLAGINFTPSRNAPYEYCQLAQAIPQLQGFRQEIRKWTIRYGDMATIRSSDQAIAPPLPSTEEPAAGEEPNLYFDSGLLSSETTGRSAIAEAASLQHWVTESGSYFEPDRPVSEESDDSGDGFYHR
jgi:hypothetical protein